MPKTFLTVLILLSYAVLVGCGTKGPLYIPEQRYPQKIKTEVPTTPNAAPANQTTNDSTTNE
ncbi:MAG: lipoprotein [Methylophilaceae bacterium]